MKEHSLQHPGPRRKVDGVIIAATRDELTAKLDVLVRAASGLRNLTPRDPNTAVAISKVEAEIDSARMSLGYGRLKVRL